MKNQNKPPEWNGYTLDELKSRRIVTQIVLNTEMQKMRQNFVPQPPSLIAQYLSRIITQLTSLIPRLSKIYSLYRQIKDLFEAK